MAAARTAASAGRRGALRLDAELGAVRRASRRPTATRCCRRRCARGWRSKRAWRRAGIATSAIAGDVLGVDRFGASAPGDVLLREYGFTVEQRLRAREGAAGVASLGSPCGSTAARMRTHNPGGDGTMNDADDLQTCLAAGRYVDSAHPAVIAFASRRPARRDPREIAVAPVLRGARRHPLRPVPHRPLPRRMTASRSLASGHGFCVTKAALLAAALRVHGIPAGLASPTYGTT